MAELLKTVFTLSLLGFGITALLLLLKPITAKKFPARWQYYVWIAVMLSMILPVYKLIPAREVQKIPLLPQNEVVQQGAPQELGEAPRMVVIEDTPIQEREISITPSYRIGLTDLLSYLWLFGMCIYLIIVISSYILYISRKRMSAVTITENAVLCEVKRELGIKRHIKIRMSQDIQSPMLVGVLFPVVYLPCREIPDENMRMVFLHELTHYKRKDLLIKWLSLFVNAVHWFNPLAYLLCSNVSEACEVSCDMEVTKKMTDEEQKLYMKTILDLAQ
ncbi:MAG: M56 family metallopeptidase [Ruminococcaceae bacterium]|nr:M56 family metallopeptidase [Oscillospiraceae bacterium]